MSGTRLGSIKTRDTNIRLYGKDYYARIGAIGGKAQVPKGFAMMAERKTLSRRQTWGYEESA